MGSTPVPCWGFTPRPLLLTHAPCAPHWHHTPRPVVSNTNVMPYTVVQSYVHCPHVRLSYVINFYLLTYLIKLHHMQRMYCEACTFHEHQIFAIFMIWVIWIESWNWIQQMFGIAHHHKCNCCGLITCDWKIHQIKMCWIFYIRKSQN